MAVSVGAIHEAPMTVMAHVLAIAQRSGMRQVAVAGTD